MASCFPSLHGNQYPDVTADSVWETNFEVQEPKDYARRVPDSGCWYSFRACSCPGSEERQWSWEDHCLLAIHLMTLATWQRLRSSSQCFQSLC